MRSRGLRQGDVLSSLRRNYCRSRPAIDTPRYTLAVRHVDCRPAGVGGPDDALADGENSGTKRVSGLHRDEKRSRPVRQSLRQGGRAVSPPAAATQSVPKLEPVNSAVYRTSVEQLYQDYDANEVAIQSKIDGNPIRVSGSVAEINEDTSGHAVVTLHTGGGDNAEMLLIDDQRSAAAQLSKEDAVEIQCNKMQRTAARLRGSGCALVLVDSGGKPVYLAVSLSGKTGTAPLYIAGPMPRRTCLASGDSMAAQLASNPISEHILSKSCAATARESVSVEGCHLSSTMLAMPDLPTAHLWKYDCIVPGAKTRTAEAANSKGTREKRTAATATLSEPVWELRPASVSQPMEGAVVAASDLDAPAPQQPAPVAVPAAVPDSTSAAPTPSAAADDLAPVRTKDPEAAVRIASYCTKITSGAANPATVAMRCRQDEVEAWTRLTVQNEFPTLDETSRRKCNEPPFPDSFVARETCAKYQLHLD